MGHTTATSISEPTDAFLRRHLGPDEESIQRMLATLGVDSLETLADEAIPRAIRMVGRLSLPGLDDGAALGERAAIERLRSLAENNRVFRSFIGMGYYDCIVPPIIQRNVLEDPGWYTQYTPYQAEISQGRLEALLNFQTMVADLSGLPVANASLLDEATAAAEAMHMCQAIARGKRKLFFVSEACHPQTIAVVKTRAEALGIEVTVGDHGSVDFGSKDLLAVLLQYPTTDGRVLDYEEIAQMAHRAGALVVVAADLLALTLLRPPGELGADIVVGSAQRFGVPLGYGGPHAAFLATADKHKRQVPGRIIGVSVDSRGKPAYRMALQTREQHIRRDKATSNICTAQALLAIMAGMYGVYHGPEGLKAIARRIHTMTEVLRLGLRRLGYDVGTEPCFDTLRVSLGDRSAASVLAAAREREMNLLGVGEHEVGLSLDECTTVAELETLLDIFALGAPRNVTLDELAKEAQTEYEAPLSRTSAFMTHPVFSAYHSEHEMLRYITRLRSRDLSLTRSMIPLGSCTMKLNATSELLPVSWPLFSDLHPFAPVEQAAGYKQVVADLEAWLSATTGLPATTLQPNAGSQGEYAGLMVIRAFHRDHGDTNRDVCLIPGSAHGTNPASAVMAGMRVVAVACDKHGNIDVTDLREKAGEHSGRLAALMVTYPSTHGVFEDAIRTICDVVHEHGGQVYLDGANMNAQVGLCRPGDYGADVCHLNLHKTFAIPHGGGGPGVGPICVAEHLRPYLPSHPVVKTGGERGLGPIAAAPWGSAGVLPISWMYIAMMGAEGLLRASQVAILNANYMAARLKDHYPILYTGARGRVAHEFIIDLRPYKESAGVEAEDVAKRLMDFGFHAPTMSFPVAGTLMVEPTESESKAEIDRLCDALIAIRDEIRAIEENRIDSENNALKNAPHTADMVVATAWDKPYSREQAAFPAPWVQESKFWPCAGRIDNVRGDRNLVCTCPPLESYT